MQNVLLIELTVISRSASFHGISFFTSNNNLFSMNQKLLQSRSIFTVEKSAAMLLL